MPPGINSRYLFCWGVKDPATGKLTLSEREPFLYQPFSDNRTYTVVQGDTIFNIAERAFPSFKRACGLFWVIADFQPTPITDVTLSLAPGTVLVIPSEQTVRERVFNEKRRKEFAG
jgi:hypothetical protein